MPGKPVEHRPLLFAGLGGFGPVIGSVFLAEVPDQGAVVTEAGYELAVVELTLRTGIAAVQEGFVLGLVEYEVKDHAQAIGVVEDHLPLVKLADVEAVQDFVAGVGPDVLAVAADIHRQEVEAVDADRG